MPSYRTEIDVPADRYVFLQLPDRVPEGRATVIVSYPASPGDAPEDPDPDREDIEWWDEFEGGTGAVG